MPLVSVDVDDTLRSALAGYTSEVGEILEAVRREAAEAGVAPDRFYPIDVANEWKAVEMAGRVLQEFGEEGNLALRVRARTFQRAPAKYSSRR